MKRLLIILLLVVLAVTFVSARTVEELYEEVVEKSGQYKEILLISLPDFVSEGFFYSL